MAHPVIEAQDLGRTFAVGKRRNRSTLEAVRELNFAVEPGERVAFIGPNGAGKSTSIKMLTGILYPSSGTATVLGHVPWEERSQLNRRIGTLFGQRSQLWNELPPRASFTVLGAIFGLTSGQTERRVSELGELLSAADLFDRPIRTQSLGQRMRCELAACMLHQPELLFLDEPTIGLDLLGKQVFRDVLMAVNRELGTTIFLTSHDVSDIEQVAERAIVVNHGTVIYDNTVDAMRRELLSSKRIELGMHSRPTDEVVASFATMPGVTVSGNGASDGRGSDPGDAHADDSVPDEVGRGARAGPSLTIDVDTSRISVRDVLDPILASVAVSDLTIVDPPLETVIGEIYQRPRS